MECRYLYLVFFSIKEFELLMEFSSQRKWRKRSLLNNILRRKANWIGHIPRRNCLLHDATEEQMTVVKGVGRRKIQLLEDFRNRRRGAKAGS